MRSRFEQAVALMDAVHHHPTYSLNRLITTARINMTVANEILAKLAERGFVVVKKSGGNNRRTIIFTETGLNLLKRSKQVLSDYGVKTR